MTSPTTLQSNYRNAQQEIIFHHPAKSYLAGIGVDLDMAIGHSFDGQTQNRSIMLSYEFYKIIHLLGISLVVMAVGGILLFTINGGTKVSNTFRKGAMMTHGIGLLLVLVGGFGLLARLGIHAIPFWAAGKLVIWLLFGALVGLAYKPNLARKLWVAVPALVVAAAALAIMKPGA